MVPFLDENFLLHTDTSIKLYHEYAKNMPIYDYHCHIDPKDILEDRRFQNITELWLGGDHYKWRLMRSNGVSEDYITGNRPDREKFQKFAEALPRAIGNPMVHWCHLELKNYFGYEGFLTGDTAQEVWDLTTEKLQDPSFSARNLIQNSNVAMIGTTDDPCSDLEAHREIGKLPFATKVCPSFRPDPAINIHKAGFRDYINTLEKTVGFSLNTVEDVAKALSERMQLFEKMGCRVADHGLDYLVYATLPIKDINLAFQKARDGKALTKAEEESYITYLLLHCAKEYHQMGWAMQLHFSCMRNPNSKAMALLGADTGFDCIASTENCKAAFSLLDALDKENQLPKTILYSLNPADNAWIDSLLGAFQSDEMPGKIQHGSAWWFNDHKDGMESQLKSLANLGILGNFIGMLTDSRSLLSYARHEYFRRVLCNLLGTWVESGEYPNDIEYVGSLVQDICANNAKRYFHFE